jgi:phospholipase C
VRRNDLLQSVSISIVESRPLTLSVKLAIAFTLLVTDGYIGFVRVTSMGKGMAKLRINFNSLPLLTMAVFFGAALSVRAQTLSPTSVNFGNWAEQNTSTPQNVTFSNTQSTSLTITSISASGDFAETSTCPVAPNTLAAGDSCQISVTFTPTALGVRGGKLKVEDSYSEIPQTAGLEGTGIVQVNLPSSVTFASEVITTTSAPVIGTLRNNQSVPLTISSISTSGNFAQTSNCPQPPHALGAGDSCKISMTFTPSALGLLTGTLTVDDSASSSPQTVSLSGTGTMNGLLSILLTPASPTLQLENQQQYTATGSWPGGLQVNITSFVSWSSSAPTIASVNSAGLAQALWQGETSITASYGSVSGSSELTVSGSPIQHVLILVQENRDTDNLFQDPVLIGRGADIVSSGVNSKGQIIPLTPIDLGTEGPDPDTYDVEHYHQAFVQMCDLNQSTGICKMDGADKVVASCEEETGGCPPNPQFKYVYPSDVAPYFQMAEQYTFADHMFQTNQGPSFPAHQFILSGTSIPSVTNDLFVAENPPTAFLSDTGCTSAPDAVVQLIDAQGNENQEVYPCFEHPTLTDLLETANISWRYYGQVPVSIWIAPNAIEHICGPNVPPPNGTECIGSEWVNDVSISTPQNPAPILTDIANGQLAGVSWVTPPGQSSDHGSGNDGTGPSWIASIVNAIGNSAYWDNTAIFITWDDWGGWYDHVAPQIINSYEYGFRVPLIAVSPYAKAAYISQVTHDFGSILKFVEWIYNLPSLGYADAPADNLSDCFNFSQTPIPFQTIQAPVGADFFLHDPRPPTPLDND